MAALALCVLAACLAVVSLRRPPAGTSKQFWLPALASPKPVLICFRAQSFTGHPRSRTTCMLRLVPSPSPTAKSAATNCIPCRPQRLCNGAT